MLINDADLKFLVQGIDLKLKHVSAMGVYGWNSICETVATEWLEDISKIRSLSSHTCLYLLICMLFISTDIGYLRPY